MNNILTELEIRKIHDIVAKNNKILSTANEEKIFEFIARLIYDIQLDRLKKEICVYENKE